jgi:hypothetical protein
MTFSFKGLKWKLKGGGRGEIKRKPSALILIVFCAYKFVVIAIPGI